MDLYPIFYISVCAFPAWNPLLVIRLDFFRMELASVFNEISFVKTKNRIPSQINRYCLPLRFSLLPCFFLRCWEAIGCKPFRSLPVHWYHLFVSIRYHNNFLFSRRNFIQINEFIFVQNTDFRLPRTLSIDTAKVPVLELICWAAFRPSVFYPCCSR